jgi:putative copper export protein
VLIVLRIIGVFNAAIWLGSAIFFTFGIAPGIFSAEMEQIFTKYYTGIIGQHLIGRYFAVNLICGLIALLHFFAEMIYAGKPFRRFTFALLVAVLALGLVGGYVFSPKIKILHQLRYHGTAEERPLAEQQFKRLHAVSAIGNLVSLIALIIYTWRVTNPPDPTRFVSAQKFRG